MRFAARQKKERTAADAVLFLYIYLILSSQNHFPSNEADRCFCAPSFPTISRGKGEAQVAFSAPRYSHSIVAGGFDDTSYTTRLTPLTLFIISFESRASTS